MNLFTIRSNVSPLHLRQLDMAKTSNFKGYSGSLSSNIDPNGAGDSHEGFEFGWEGLGDMPGSLASNHLSDGAMMGANVWPDVPGFREALLQY
jgi:isopenicillin N synthase-like dioxygenase